MKVAIASKGKGLNSEIDDRFGRAEYFVIIDLDTLEEETIENISKNESSGAGGNTVRALFNKKVDAIISPELGPKAVTAVQAFEIKVYKKGDFKIVKDVLKAFQNNELEEVDFKI